MTAIAGWIYTPIAQSFGWALVHFVWEGAALALLLSVALWLAGAGSRRRYALACLTLALMPVAFGATVAVLRARQPARVERVAVSAAPGQPAASAEVMTELLPAPPRLSAAGIVYRWGWVVPVWCAGVLLFYLRGLAGWMGVGRMQTRGLCAVSGEWQARFAHLAERVGIGRTAALFESCFTEVPVLVGYLRPVVLLPVGCLAGLPVSQVECILLHELAHIRRHDYLVNLIQSGLEGLLFYHPAVWWVSSVVRAEREDCCDDAVVEWTGDARSYALTLAAIEQRRAPSTAMAASGGSLMKRIRRLTGRTVPVPIPAAPAALAAMLTVIFAAGLMALPAKKLESIRSRQMAAAGRLRQGLPVAATVTHASGPAAREQLARVFSSTGDLKISAIVTMPAGTIAVGDVLTVTRSLDAIMTAQLASRRRVPARYRADDPALIIVDLRHRTVRPDGKVSIGGSDFQAAGLTAGQLESALDNVWGQDAASVTVEQGAAVSGTVTVLLPPSTEGLHVDGQITRAGKLVRSFESDNTATIARAIPLRTGWYTLRVATKDPVSQAVRIATVDFQVE